MSRPIWVFKPGTNTPLELFWEKQDPIGYVNLVIAIQKNRKEKSPLEISNQTCFFREMINLQKKSD